MLQCMLMYYDHRLMISRLIVYALATLPKIVAENEESVSLQLV